MDPKAEILIIALAGPRVSAESQGAKDRQRDKGGDVEHRQIVPAHIQDLESCVFHEGFWVNLREPRVVRHPQHHQSCQRTERPIGDAGQSVKREVKVCQLPEIPERRLRYLCQRVVAAVQVHQVGQVVEPKRGQLSDAVVGDDELPRGQGHVAREGGQLLPGALDHQLLITHALVGAARGEHRGCARRRGKKQHYYKPQGLRTGLWGKTHVTAEGFIHPGWRYSCALTFFIDELSPPLPSPQAPPNEFYYR